MRIVIELPPRLEEELSIDASREDVTPAEQATLFLYLAAAMTVEGTETPFRGAVRSFLGRHLVDFKRVALACDQLRKLCLEGELRPDSPASAGIDEFPGSAEGVELDGLDERQFDLLRAWRSSIVHQPSQRIGTSGASAHDPTRQTSQSARPSIRGKYAYLGLSSEDYAREKQLEIEREDRI